MHAIFSLAARWLRKTSSSIATATAAQTPQLSPPPEKQASDAQTEPEAGKDVKVRLGEECDDLGFRTARKSWKREPDEIDLKALDGKADSIAQALHRPPSGEKDERQREKLKQSERDIKGLRTSWEAAAAQRRDLVQQRAEHGDRESRPRIKPVFRQAAIVGLVIAFAPNFHDLMVNLPSILPWVCAAVCALGVSLLIVHGILPPEE